ncbi:hypothetical protein QUF80_02340 [Desulfococcaceae bacterium HSG8]|nr:hypothetical protein [Desulfococcaceae bacterium HSG8]
MSIPREPVTGKSRITHHASRITFHVSRFTHHVSRTGKHSQSCFIGF